MRDELAAAGFDHVVLCGMGGSSLAPEVICAHGRRAARSCSTPPTPTTSRAALADRLDRTVVVVSSKSGRTVETDSQRRAFEQAFTDAGIDPTARIVVVTDPGSPARRRGPRGRLPRSSTPTPTSAAATRALTAFGLVPSGLAGADVERAARRRRGRGRPARRRRRRQPGPARSAPRWPAPTPLRDKLVLVDDGSGIVGFGDWAEQLIAESTGKHGTGILPVVVDGARRARALPSDGTTRAPRRRSAPTTTPRTPATGGIRRDRRRPARRTVAALGVRHGGRRPAARHQPVRPARRRERQGGRPRAARRGSRGRGPGRLHRRRRRGAGARPATGSATPPPSTARSTRCSAQLDGEHGYLAVMAYLDRLADADLERRRARRSLAAPVARSPSAGGRASCTRPGSTTRADRRPASTCRSPAAPHAGPRRARPAVHASASFIAAQAGRRRRRCSPTTAARCCGCTSPTTTPACAQAGRAALGRRAAA